nr:D-2-hydroxyacid dehydrogenase [uncultured Desulfobacter sp.]
MNRLLILSQDAEEYSDLIHASQLPHLKIDAYNSLADVTADAMEANLVLGDPDLLEKILPDLQNLQWAQSTWAGVTPLLKKECRKDYLLTNVKDIFGPIMSEYVLCYILMHERKALLRYESQKKRSWNAVTPGRLKNRTMGILGVGSIGRSIAQTAKYFQMKTKGYARRPLTCRFIDQRYDATDKLADFVQDVDYLVSTLPDTPDTNQLLDKDILNAMKPESLLINVGRGNVLDENALIEATTKGHIAGAVLDVFNEEPLPDTHPFWGIPEILITAHTAAMSYPEDIASVFIGNYQRFHTGIPLKYPVDFDLGY